MGTLAPRLDTDSLLVFLAVAEQGGALAAARTVGRSQPAVTTRIRQLEGLLGTALFLRSARGMTLTASGRELLGYARRVRELLLEAEHRVAAEVAGAASRLVLAASTTPAAYVLAPLVADFLAQGGAGGVEVRVGNSGEVLAAVRDGVVALGVVEGGGSAAGVTLRHFLDDELVPVVSERAAPALRAQLAQVRSLRDLAGVPILWREPGSGTRRVVEAAFRAAGVPARDLRPERVLGGTATIKAAVLAGLGVAFLPRCAIESELLLRRLTAVGPALAIRRAFHWATAAGGVPAPMAAFQRFAQRRVGRRRPGPAPAAQASRAARTWSRPL